MTKETLETHVEVAVNECKYGEIDAKEATQAIMFYVAQFVEEEKKSLQS